MEELRAIIAKNTHGRSLEDALRVEIIGEMKSDLRRPAHQVAQRKHIWF
jgi:hypothetical protein